jgi:hypothetical protein
MAHQTSESLNKKVSRVILPKSNREEVATVHIVSVELRYKIYAVRAGKKIALRVPADIEKAAI